MQLRVAVQETKGRVREGETRKFDVALVSSMDVPVGAMKRQTTAKVAARVSVRDIAKERVEE